MAKGQSTIMQYVLFFTIGISLFITLGNSFLSQYVTFNADLSSTNIMLANSFVSSHIVYLYNQCKQCQQISENMTLQNVTRLFQLVVSPAGIAVNAPLANASYFSSVHNLNYTNSSSCCSLNFAATPFPVTFSRTINISINKDKNTLGVSDIR